MTTVTLIMNPPHNVNSGRKPKLVFTLDTPYSEAKWYMSTAAFFRTERKLTGSAGLLYHQNYSWLFWTHYAGTRLILLLSFQSISSPLECGRAPCCSDVAQASKQPPRFKTSQRLQSIAREWRLFDFLALPETLRMASFLPFRRWQKLILIAVF